MHVCTNMLEGFHCFCLNILFIMLELSSCFLLLLLALFFVHAHDSKHACPCR